jgi:hypothetical protein
MIKNVSVTITYVAWDTANNVGKTEDKDNHTLRLIKNGTSEVPTNSPLEVDATNCPGIYKLVLTQAETNYNTVTLAGKSSTSGVSIMPVSFVTEQGLFAGVPAAVWAETIRKLTSAITDEVVPENMAAVTDVSGVPAAAAAAVWGETTRKLTSAYTDEVVPRDMAATGAGTSGMYTVTFTTQEAGPVNLANVKITIRSSTGVLLTVLDSGSSGVVTTDLDDGDYTAQATLAGYSFLLGSFTVAGTNLNITLRGVAISPSVPVAGTQILSILPTDPSLLLDTTCTVVAYNMNKNEIAGSAVLTSVQIAAVLATDHYELTLAKGETFKIIGKNGYDVWLDKTITVTQDDNEDMINYLP